MAKYRSASASATAALTLLLVAAAAVFNHQHSNNVGLSQEWNANEELLCGQNPSDSYIVRSLQACAKQNNQGGMFGELVTTLILGSEGQPENPTTLAMIKETIVIFNYIASVDGLEESEKRFVQRAAVLKTCGLITNEEAISLLNQRVSKTQAMYILNKPYPYNRLYWSAVAAQADGELSDAEKARLLDLTSSVNVDGQKVLNVIDKEKHVLNEMIDIMGVPNINNHGGSKRGRSKPHGFQFGHKPTDEEIVSALRVYVDHNVPAGLFGEATLDSGYIRNPASVQMMREVLTIITYVAEADGLSEKELQFAIDIDRAASGGHLSEEYIRKQLTTPVSEAEALAALKKHHPYMRLYFMAMTANSDRHFSENEKQRIIDLAEKAQLKGMRIPNLIQAETELREELIQLLSQREK